MRYRFIFLWAALCGLMSVGTAKAQSFEDEEFFKSLFPPKDTLNTDDVYQDKLIKRFSFHVNAVDWLLTMPSVGVEFDLNKKVDVKKKVKTNRSVLLFGKYNGNTKHSITPKFVFNVAAVRMEFRKYWRTGKVGLDDYYHEDYKTMDLYKPDTLWRKEMVVNNFGDSVSQNVFYFSPKDSAEMIKRGGVGAYEYEGDPNRGRLSNVYENSRRLISTRTIENARNWRAYYLGAFLGWDKYSWCFGKKGEQGNILSVGATFGWSIPLMAARNSERGLDLDLGLNAGLPFVKYEGYKYIYQEGNSYYAHRGRSLDDGWSINPKYILRDVHVSLVYRFRSISRKVSLAIVDDYQKHIDEWKERRARMIREKQEIEARAAAIKDSLERSQRRAADSTSRADDERRDYLRALMEIYPDSTLHGRDSVDYIRLILGKDTLEYVREKARADRLQQLEDRRVQDSLEFVRRSFERDSLTKARIEKNKQDRARKDSLEERSKFVKDSIQHANDSIDQRRKDSIQHINDSIQGVKNRVRDSIQHAKDAARKAEQDKRNAAQRARQAREDSAQAARQAIIDKQKAEEKHRKDSIETVEKNRRVEAEAQRKVAESQREAERKEEARRKEAEKIAKQREREAEKEAEEVRKKLEQQNKEAEKQRKAAEAEQKRQAKEAVEADKRQAAEEKAAAEKAEKEEKAREAAERKRQEEDAKVAEEAAKKAEALEREKEKAAAKADKTADANEEKRAKDEEKAQKAAEKAAEKAQREREKAEAKAQREREKAEAKAAKEAEKAARKAEKEAEKSE